MNKRNYISLGPARLRPSNPTPLAEWMRRHGISGYEMAKRTGASPSSVVAWAEGRTFPTLIAAFKIAAATKDGVPVSSWLGTEIGRRTWEDFGIDWARWDTQRAGVADRQRARKVEKLHARRREREASETPGTPGAEPQA